MHALPIVTSGLICLFLKIPALSTTSSRHAGIPLDWKDTFLNRYGFDTEATGGAVEFRLHCAHVRQPAQKVYSPRLCAFSRVVFVLYLFLVFNFTLLVPSWLLNSIWFFLLFRMVHLCNAFQIVPSLAFYVCLFFVRDSVENRTGHVDAARANDCTGRRRGRAGGCLGLSNRSLDIQFTVCRPRKSVCVRFYLGYACFTLCSANPRTRNTQVVCVRFDKTMK
jgi:hypothetical protein